MREGLFMYVGAKYAALTHYLTSCGENRISLSIDEISKIIPLPKWVRNDKAVAWSNTTQSFAAGWRNAGYIVEKNRVT